MSFAKGPKRPPLDCLSRAIDDSRLDQWLTFTWLKEKV